MNFVRELTPHDARSIINQTLRPGRNYECWAAEGMQDDLHPPRIHMEPKNGGLEDDFPFQLG